MVSLGIAGILFVTVLAGCGNKPHEQAAIDCIKATCAKLKLDVKSCKIIEQKRDPELENSYIIKAKVTARYKEAWVRVLSYERREKEFADYYAKQDEFIDLKQWYTTERSRNRDLVPDLGEIPSFPWVRPVEVMYKKNDILKCEVTVGVSPWGNLVFDSTGPDEGWAFDSESGDIQVNSSEWHKMVRVLEKKIDRLRQEKESFERAVERKAAKHEEEVEREAAKRKEDAFSDFAPWIKPGRSYSARLTVETNSGKEEMGITFHILDFEKVTGKVKIELKSEKKPEVHAIYGGELVYDEYFESVSWKLSFYEGNLEEYEDDIWIPFSQKLTFKMDAEQGGLIGHASYYWLKFELLAKEKNAI